MSKTDLPRELRTDRLRLRRWRPSDLAPFAALNLDQEVTRYLLKALSRKESDFFASRITSQFDLHGFGLWAVEICNTVAFAGFIGLSVRRFEAHFTPCVEISWRLAPEYWGRGYATEGAHAALNFGFNDLDLSEIVSFTVHENKRSRRVMERIGMTHNPDDDFDHPTLPNGHRLRSHVLYRMSHR